jgi:hypothetical protein
MSTRPRFFFAGFDGGAESAGGFSGAGGSPSLDRASKGL